MNVHRFRRRFIERRPSGLRQGRSPRLKRCETAAPALVRRRPINPLKAGRQSAARPAPRTARRPRRPFLARLRVRSRCARLRPSCSRTGASVSAGTKRARRGRRRGRSPGFRSSVTPGAAERALARRAAGTGAREGAPPRAGAARALRERAKSALAF